MQRAKLERIDTRPIPSASAEARAFMVVHNELNKLPFTLDHHRQLGVERFFIVDNDSTDGTVDFLAGQPDVHVFSTAANYQDARLGIDWLETLLHEYGTARWCLVLDGDEHLVYPDCEQLSITALTAALDARGINCVVTQFLDMYANNAIARTVLRSPRSLLDACPFFDSAGYHDFSAVGSVIPRHYGGPRARLFWPEFDFARRAAEPCAFVERAFDEAAYLELHADVRAAVLSGELPSGREHYVRYGHAEGRRVVVRALSDWPESTYLGIHPDVRDGVHVEAFNSGLEHYVRYGVFEGRRLWAHGPPCITQVPLVKWDRGMQLNVGRHSLIGAAGGQRHVIGGVLLHFKLTADLARRARHASERRGAADGTWRVENERYTTMLQRYPEMSAMSSISQRYQNAEQLLRFGLMQRLV